MVVRRSGVKFLVLGVLVALSTPTTFSEADAATQADAVETRSSSAYRLARGDARAMQDGILKAKRSRHARTGVGTGGILQCVPFARENSGIEIIGNAGTWWRSAVGIYERGSRPEVGSVLNFRAGGRSRLGHVAVVTKVLNPRMIEVDHANWSAPSIGRGRISRDMAVMDVSEANDWTAVRVEVGQDGFGSVYPTYGFIYDRPDRGLMVANTTAVPRLPANPATRVFRPSAGPNAGPNADRAEFQEVAEAPEDVSRPALTPVRMRVRAAGRFDQPTVYVGSRGLTTLR